MAFRPPKSKFGYIWLTAFLFLFSLAGHWIFAWYAYQSDQEMHHQPVHVSDYLIETGRDTLENWQSEFLQLIWQVAGLAFLWCVGSPQSKEGDNRKEEKLDWIVRKLDPANAESILTELEARFPKK